MSPAEYVIRCFGGVNATARAVGRLPSTVSKWRHDYGTGGQVPGALHRRLLELAHARGLDITPHDLIYGRTLVPGEPK